MRAFVAVPVESRELLERLGDARRPFPRLYGVKWIPTQQLHFTLKFLGEVEGARLDAARAAVETAATEVPPFSLALDGLGVFPPRGEVRMLWAGCGEGRGQLEQLAARVEESFAAAGFDRETRRFTAHLTLARVKEPAAGRALVPHLPREGGPSFGLLPVKELVLFRSDLAPSGPTYTPILRAPLVARAD